jgi:tetratricopeptide (TPR) repeat protein
MPLFVKETYDRSRTLARAAKAEARGHRKKAIAEYRKVLAQEPENVGAMGKLAALLARTKQGEEALQKFAVCAEHYEKQGFDDKALAVYRQASGYLPRRVELWVQIGRLQVKRGNAADAIMALLEGRTHFRRKKLHAQAIQLLREVLKVEPWHFEATLDLARLLARCGQKREAVRLCEGLCVRKRGPQRRAALRALFWIAPSPAVAWSWLRAWLKA